jgi:hypothetical protein
MVKLVSELSDKHDIKQEVAANTMICLIHQELFLLNRQIACLGGDFEKMADLQSGCIAPGCKNEIQILANSNFSRNFSKKITSFS